MSPLFIAAQSAVLFGQQLNANQLLAASKQIKTFTEQVEDETEISLMRSKLFEAQRIVYLGFSYGRMNMDLMKLEGLDGRVASKHITGTAFGESSENTVVNLSLIEKSIYEIGGRTDNIRLVDLKCHEFLKNFKNVLSN